MESTGSSWARVNPAEATGLEAAGVMGDWWAATTGVLADESGLTFGCFAPLATATLFGVNIANYCAGSLGEGCV